MIRQGRSALAVLLLAIAAWAGAALAEEAKPLPPGVTRPEPTVPEIYTLMGQYVRVAYNNEGYVILGYRTSNLSVGEEWMLLEVGITLREKVPDYRLTREAISLDTPDGKTIPLPSIAEQRAGNVNPIQLRAKVQRDSINYFPPKASRACALLFFPDLDARSVPFNDVDLSDDRACLGRFYFKIPGGIAYGQHWLNVKFQNSVVRVPFRILTDDEEKFVSKNYKSIEKQVKDAFRTK